MKYTNVALPLALTSILTGLGCDEAPATRPDITSIAALAPADLALEAGTAAVEFRLRRAFSHDGVERETTSVAWDNHELDVGDRRSFILGIGDADACESTFSGEQQTSPGMPPQTKKYRHVWRAIVDRKPAEIGHLRFGVHWQHFFNSGTEAPRLLLERTTELHLPEHGANVLDFVHSGGVPVGPCEPTVHVDISAHVVEDPRLSERLLVYDLWHEHRSGEDETVTRRFLGSGRQGKTVEFEMPPVSVDVPESRNPLAIFVLGTIQARWRDDDTAVVRLKTLRKVRGFTDDGRPDGTVGRGGAEVFVMRPGQTVEMILSPVTGGVGGGQVSAIDVGEALADHEDALVLTVRGPDDRG